MKLRALTAAVVFAALTFTSCGSSVWKTNLDAGKSAAAKQNKDIYLLFSGDDWNEESVAFKQSVANTKEFEEAFKDYVLVNVDLSQDHFAPLFNHYQAQQTGEEEKLNKKQEKQIKALEEEYQQVETTLQNYGIRNFPQAYILSSDGIVLLNLPFNAEITDAASYKADVESKNDALVAVKDLINNVKIATGVEKVKAIDALCEASNAYIGTLRSYIDMVPELDPENESGLVGEYLVRGAYMKTSDVIKNGGDGAELFEELAENPILSTSLKQEAYFVAAYNLAVSGSQDFDRMLSNLNKSYDVNPQSEHVSDITSAIEQVKQMKEQAEQYAKYMAEQAQAEAAESAPEASEK